jgi:hypothetical protein
MLSWMQQFRWPKETSSDELATIGISWYELVLSFMRYSEMFFPLRRSDNHGREHLIPFKSRQQVEAYGVKFSEFANTFAIFYLQFTGLLSTDIWPGYDRKLVKSLFVDLLSAHPFPTKHGCMMCFDLSYMTIKEQPSLRFLTLIGSCLKVNTRF